MWWMRRSAAALVQTAVDPQMCGIAGMGCLHLYLPSLGVHTTIDFHGAVSGSHPGGHVGGSDRL